MSGAGVFLTGRNLFLITNTFVDPELNMTTNFSGAVRAIRWVLSGINSPKPAVWEVGSASNFKKRVSTK